MSTSDEPGPDPVAIAALTHADEVAGRLDDALAVVKEAVEQIHGALAEIVDELEEAGVPVPADIDDRLHRIWDLADRII